MQEIIEDYKNKFRKSGEIAKQGQQLVPGGAHQSRQVWPHPIFVDKALGALKWDADGNELIDYMMGFGALLLGNAHPAVTKAISDRVAYGTHMGTASKSELHWARLVKEMMPGVERVRFTASGTEATLLAIRLARGYSRKTKVAKFKEHFHGWHDYLSPESGINTQIGIPRETLSTVVVLEPEIDAVERYLSQDDDVAAVIVEPTGGHWGQFPLGNPSFLASLRDITEKNNVVMIMDEVVSGFRLARGGAQERFGVVPDLTTMAKIVAGGLPGGAVGGKAYIMDLLASSTASERLNHPGTFNANPVSAAAGIAVLDLVANQPINEMADLAAARLKEGLRHAITRMEVLGHVHGIASIVHVALGVGCNCEGEICTLPHSQLRKATAPPVNTLLKLSMLNEGVDMMGGIGFMVSSVHEEAQIEQTIEAFEKTLYAFRKGGVL